MVGRAEVPHSRKSGVTESALEETLWSETVQHPLQIIVFPSLKLSHNSLQLIHYRYHFHWGCALINCGRKLFL